MLEQKKTSPLSLACKRQGYDSIQLMRGVAAVSVIFHHILMFTNGAFGVDLFFCISGFIMMYITEKNGDKFLEKRAIRIIPLYWLGTLAVIALLLVVPQYFNSTNLSVPRIIKSFLFIPYADDVSGYPLLIQGWTLVCEVFFYVVFFVSMKISHKQRHMISSGILCAVVAVSAILGERISPDIKNYYGNPMMLEFIFGMIGYKFITYKTSLNEQSKSGKQSVILLIVAVALWAFLFSQKYIPFLHDINRVISWGIPSFLFFLLIFRYFKNRSVPLPFVFIGNISYSLYITHTFIVHPFSRLVYDISVFSPVGVLLVFVVVIPLCLAVAFVSWFLIEYKFTMYLRKKFKI
ncbi:MAG: acyltransferase [Proteobacteria bacterium]|nr:acyltransferase [Pseudomonadota bacterium]